MSLIKIDRKFGAKILFECSVSVDGESYLIIFGEHINGYFCCIPDRGWGCEMAEAEDVFYNANQLVQCGVDLDIAQSIAGAICDVQRREEGAL